MTSASRAWTLGLACGAGLICLLSSLYAIALHDPNESVAASSAVATQWILLLALAVRTLHTGRRWATAEFTVLAAWFGLFSLPSLIFAVRPDLLERTTTIPVHEAAAFVNLALLALAVGLVAAGRVARMGEASVSLHELETRPGVLLAWFTVGLVGIGILFAANDGPIAYLTNLDDVGSMTAGLLPVVWLSQFTRYAATVALATRWARDERPGMAMWLFACTGVGIAALVGARAFVAVAAVQLLLSYAVLRRPPALRVIFPLALLVTVVLVLGGGALKRYANYESAHPSDAVGLGEYLVSIAPGEALDAYATNYADGVRYVGLAIETVPQYADYEGLAPIEDLVTRILPRAIRPEVNRQPAIAETFLPRDGASPAIPLMVTLFVAGGAGALVLGFALLGVGVAAIDKSIASRERASFPIVAAKLSLITQLPILIRSGVPAGAIFLALDVAAVYLVSATATRSSGAVVPHGPLGYLRSGRLRRSSISDWFASTR